MTTTRKPFTIPLTISTLLVALGEAHLEYEAAKEASDKATQAALTAEENSKLLKRQIIDELFAGGTAITRAEKEYANDERWDIHQDAVTQIETDKRAAYTRESIARQRMLTLRALIVPMTFSAIRQDAEIVHSFDSGAENALYDAGLTNAEDDPAFSDDPSVAHS